MVEDDIRCYVNHSNIQISGCDNHTDQYVHTQRFQNLIVDFPLIQYIIRASSDTLIIIFKLPNAI